MHFAFRDVPIDNVTIALALVAALPWLALILKTVSLPGGVTLEFRELLRRVQSLDARVKELQQFVIHGVDTKLAAHLTKLREYVSRFAGPLAERPAVYVEGSQMGSCNIPETHEIVVQRPYALDQDVVGRQYMHSVLSARPMSDDFELRGLESGLADYFVASARGQPLLDENSGLGQIQLANERKFADGFATEDAGNDLGEIWGGGFWRIRDLLGQARADAAFWTAWSQMDVTAKDAEAQTRTAFLERLVRVTEAQNGSTAARDVEAILSSRGLSASL